MLSLQKPKITSHPMMSTKRGTSLLKYRDLLWSSPLYEQTKEKGQLVSERFSCNWISFFTLSMEILNHLGQGYPQGAFFFWKAAGFSCLFSFENILLLIQEASFILHRSFSIGNRWCIYLIKNKYITILLNIRTNSWPSKGCLTLL